MEKNILIICLTDVSSLINIKPLENWNVTNGECFQYLFYNCRSFNDISPLKEWNTTNSFFIYIQ